MKGPLTVRFKGLAPTAWRSHLMKLVLMIGSAYLAVIFSVQAGDRNSSNISLYEILQKWQKITLTDTAAAAEKGDLTAQHYLGYYHLEGLGEKSNPGEGLAWYRRAAASGFPNSINNLGVAYKNGKAVEKDEAKAVEYFRQAADLGFYPALRNLAGMLARDEAGGKEKEAIRRRLEAGARAGDTEAQIQLAYFVLYPPGGGTIEHQNAAYLLKKAASLGRVDAFSALGQMYMESHGAIDYAQAHKWHLLAAEKEVPSSETALGWMYFNGFGVTADSAKAYEWLGKAVARNYVPAMVNMGRFLALDDIPNPPDGFQPDYPKAAVWYDRAAKLGHSRARFYLGRLIWMGQVLGYDKSKARPLLQQAAEQGVSSARELMRTIDMENAAGTAEELQLLEAMALDYHTPSALRLARKFLRGKGVPQDFFRAVRFSFRARNYGSEEAWIMLAILDDDDQPRSGLNKEEAAFAAALSQITRAMKKHDVTFFRKLGQRYLKGEELPKDVFEASIWLRLAGDRGDAEARKIEAEIEPNMSDSQKNKAQIWFLDLRDVWLRFDSKQ